MIKHIKIITTFILISLSFMQNAELVTQKINLENAIREKVNATVDKFLDPAQYIIVVNARLDFKPISFDSKQTTKQPKTPGQDSYTFIPGLDMPSIPTGQTIYKPGSETGLAGFQYSDDKYLLYGLEIIIYLDEAISTGSLQQNIKTLVKSNIPEIVDCVDCVKFETLDILNSATTQGGGLLERLETLEQERREAELELQNWRFEQLEEELAEAQDARTSWEEQARNRDRFRQIKDSTRMSNLETIERQYRGKQDSLYILTSIKLDEAIRGRIESEENTKQELIELIKLQIQGDSTENIESGLGLYNKRPLPPKGLGSQTWLMIIAILVLITILFILMKNKNTVYLKPKAQNEGTAEQGLPQQEQRQTPTQANTNEEVQKAELQALRQTAVTMTVAEKGGANQIVKDWMDDSNKEAEETAD